MDETVQPESQHPIDDASNGEVTRVLVVDDSKADRTLVVTLLAGEPFEVFTAATAAEARTVCATQSIDCVLLDYRLGAVSGIELLPGFLDRGHGVVMFTGFDDGDLVADCLRSGAHDYLLKAGLDTERLERAIRHATARARLTRELMQHKEVIAHLPIGVAVCRPIGDRDIDVVSSNPAAQAMGAAQWLSRPPRARLLRHFLAAGAPGRLPELVDPSRARTYVVRAFPVSSDRITVLFDDVSELRSAEQKSIALEKQMVAAQRLEAVGHLAGGVAHDFNNILTVIQSCAEFLRRGLVDDQQREDVDAIIDAADRAANLTNQLLTFSRRHVVQVTSVDLHTSVTDIERMLSRLLGEHIAITTELADDLWLVRADATRLEQILVNLAVNARDAMPCGGTLAIRAANRALPADHELAAGDYVHLEVADDGEGMDEATRARIFEPFFTTKGRDRGTGLGLSTVYGIVKQAGGAIRVDSTPGEGTRFHVFLPRVEGERAEPAAHQNKLIAPDDRRTVLLVEDDPLVRSAARRILRNRGYVVLEAGGGADALEVASTHTGELDLLLTDIVMPQMSGAELATRLLEQRPDLRVLYMSGYSETVAADRGEISRDAVFLEKPFRAATLLEKVSEALGPKS